MDPTSLIAKHHPAVDYGRRAPDRRAHELLPNDFSLVGTEAIHVAVVAADVNPIIDHNRAGPKRALAQPAFSFEFPDRLSV